MKVTDRQVEYFNGVRLTDEMKTVARDEIVRREPHIRHHFKTKHYSQSDSDLIGFLGEFALRELLGLDWKQGIRPDYVTIDSHDVLVREHVIDVKTESIPERYLWRVLDREIPDNEYFGRRLYHVGQKGLLSKYDVIVMGAVPRQESVDEIEHWFPIGWLNAAKLRTYPNGKKGPIHHSGKQIWYPFAAYQIATADLKSIDTLLETLS